jgi:hypothetical protein
MKKSISFSVTDEEFEAIIKYSDHYGRTPSNLAKYALKAHLKRYPLSREVLVEKIDNSPSACTGRLN